MTARIAKSSLADPHRNVWYGGAAFALSMLVFAYSPRFGQLSILAYYALWFPLCLVSPRQIFRHAERVLWAFGFATFACLSFFWSQAPGVTARASIQLVTHILCAMIAARVLSTRTLVLGGLAGVCLVVVYSLIFGVYLYDPIDGSYTFAGAFSSKNQLGFYSSLGVFFAFCTFFVLPSVGPGQKFAALGVGLLALYAMFASQSATSIAATAATLVATFAATLVLRLPARMRKLMLIAGLVCGGVALFAALNAGALNLVLDLFGKDTTLTGRTYLWSEGLAAFQEAPTVGVGYQAWWVQGFSEPERLWEEFYIASRSGFHFHNTYIEVLVELGVVGLILLVVVLVGTLWGHIKGLVSRGRETQSLVMFGLILMLLVRSFVEVDVINPYAIGSFLLYYGAGVLIGRRSRAAPSLPGAVHPLELGRA